MTPEPFPAYGASSTGIGGRSRSTGSAVVVPDLDTLPAPDFAEYFGTLRETGYAHQFVPALAMELSRGCWWAAKSPCAFCGLNGSRTTYRAKSPHRFLAESRLLTASNNASYLELVRHGRPPAPVSSPGCSPSSPTSNLCRSRSSSRSARPTMARAGFLDSRGRARRRAAMRQSKASATPSSARTNKGTTSLENLRFLKVVPGPRPGPGTELAHAARVPAGRVRGTTRRPGLSCGAVRFLPPSELGPVLVPRFSPYFAARPPSTVCTACAR